VEEAMLFTVDFRGFRIMELELEIQSRVDPDLTELGKYARRLKITEAGNGSLAVISPASLLSATCI
jgi:hypothetical protein